MNLSMSLRKLSEAELSKHEGQCESHMLIEDLDTQVAMKRTNNMLSMLM